jgi:hypothetical protein
MSGCSNSPNINPHARVQHRGVDPLVVEDLQAHLGIAAPLASHAACRHVVLQSARERILRPPEPALDPIGDVPIGFGDELHGAVAHRRRDGVDQFGKRLLDMPVGIDHE